MSGSTPWEMTWTPSARPIESRQRLVRVRSEMAITRRVDCLVSGEVALAGRSGPATVHCRQVGAPFARTDALYHPGWQK